MRIYAAVGKNEFWPGSAWGAIKKLGTLFITALILAAFPAISFGSTSQSCLTVGGTYSVDYPGVKISITVPANLPVCNIVEQSNSVKLFRTEVTGCTFDFILPQVIAKDYFLISVGVSFPNGRYPHGSAQFWIPVITSYNEYFVSIQPVGMDAPVNGTYTIAPASMLPLYAVVKDQNGVVQSGKQVTLAVDVQNGTSGHIHTENRPRGIFTCGSTGSPWTCTLTTDHNGQAPFEFLATPVSGTHTITATCAGCSNAATAPVNVKVADLIPIPVSPQLYALQDSTGAVIGAITGKHTANHYLSSTAITKLGKLANIYTVVNPGAKLYLNDASLEWGGLFDVGGAPWSSPHSAHDRGRSLDIRAANSGPNNEGAVPATLFLKFADTASKKGFRVGLHCRNSTDTNYCLGQPNNRHFHVDF